MNHGAGQGGQDRPVRLITRVKTARRMFGRRLNAIEGTVGHLHVLAGMDALVGRIAILPGISKTVLEPL